MLRLLVIIALIWVASVILRRMSAARKRPPGKSAYGGKMVKCAECGVFLPPQDAIDLGGGRHVCSAHRRGAGD
ncbi:MAG: hypothetical protein HY749_11445 [Gammaproteobacteria bacterium]|nr:hypothetical protein [Gammaproteobacteria bacterium]